MKKIDFHIHTVQSSVDAEFQFCMDKLKEYVEKASLDCIAVTNHNLFDLKQFQEISSAIETTVLPGIEIDVEKSQILVLADRSDLTDFDAKCSEVSEICDQQNGRISLDDFERIFDPLSQYILIPHYEKKPAISEDILRKLSDYITAGEVSSPKKFMYCTKDDERLVPVYFSDCRVSDSLKSLPVRQTYIDCDDISFSAIRHCLRDKSKVALSENDGNKLFQIFDDGQMLSTGLNVVLGERSSGKSHTLRRIRGLFPDVRHIEQFELVARDDDEDNRRFNEHLSQHAALFSRDYLKELQGVVDDVLDIDLDRDQRAAEKYIASLIRFAKESEKHDAFSKATLFSEGQFPTDAQKGLKDLISSTKNLVRNEEFRDIIDKHIALKRLKSLYVELMELFTERERDRLKKSWVNELVTQIKGRLQIKSAAPTISDFDAYRTAMNMKKVDRFASIVRLARTSRVIMRKQNRGFEIVAEASPFGGAGELKALSRSQVGFSDAFQVYDCPYSFLQQLKELDDRISQADYYKYFVKIDYKILNKDGFEASGGERSEFFLLQAIEGARDANMLLIDEPESSFDNLFLKNEVNEILKDLAKSMPVVLVTHNNTVGASIKPDYLLCTKKEIEGQIVSWRIYSGFPASKNLDSVDGRSIDNWEVTMGCLEAGPEAYNDRKRNYEDIKN